MHISEFHLIVITHPFYKMFKLIRPARSPYLNTSPLKTFFLFLGEAGGGIPFFYVRLYQE
jgi:hypothetical protein